jgi:hypothetical protein
MQRLTIRGDSAPPADLSKSGDIGGGKFVATSEAMLEVIPALLMSDRCPVPTPAILPHGGLVRSGDRRQEIRTSVSVTGAQPCVVAGGFRG